MQLYSQGEEDFNFGWKFALEQTDDAKLVDFDDSKWRQLDLPHDWSIEFSYDQEKGEGATGYLLGGIGWYRKSFELNRSKDERVYLYFDGVYNNSEVYLNGHKLGFHPYGYSPFYYDLTPFLNAESDENIIAVKVDRTRYADSRWYTGSGIYRNVSLIKKRNVQIPIWGVFLTTPEVTKDHASVHLAIDLRNNSDQEVSVDVLTEVYSPQGDLLEVVETKQVLTAGFNDVISQSLSVISPELWSVDSPSLYKAKTILKVSGEVVETVITPFGIRFFEFDVNSGFSLNGESMKLKGVCLHHDAGAVGAAVPKKVWRRRFETLKKAGCNAIRLAHNPASKEFLDLCDEMGFLVQNEFFDEWDNPKDKRLNCNQKESDYVTTGYTEYFQEWAQRDLTNVMLRDRNHPSIVQWSIGNEIEWTYPRCAYATGYFDASWDGNYFFEKPPFSFDQIKERFFKEKEEPYSVGGTAQKLANWTRQLDTTRPIVANCILPSVSHISGYADALDIVGYSYRRIMYDDCHKQFPDKAIMGTENLAQWHEWKAVKERPFISGYFLWTGIDYLGEANGKWPQKSLGTGFIDFAGFEKPHFHMHKAMWSENPHVYIGTQKLERSLYKVNGKQIIEPKDPKAWEHALWLWHDVNEHWNYEQGETVAVEVYSNCEEVELFLNGESFGVQKLEQHDDHIYKWAVPYVSGKLEAHGRVAGNKVAEYQINTSGKISGIELSVDETNLAADGYDACHLVAQLVDENGVPVLVDDQMVQFEIDGNCRNLGVDNGANDNVQDHQTTSLVTSKGRALLILGSKTEPDTIRVSASAADLRSNEVVIAMTQAL